MWIGVPLCSCSRIELISALHAIGFGFETLSGRVTMADCILFARTDISGCRGMVMLLQIHEMQKNYLWNQGANHKGNSSILLRSLPSVHKSQHGSIVHEVEQFEHADKLTSWVFWKVKTYITRFLENIRCSSFSHEKLSVLMK